MKWSNKAHRHIIEGVCKTLFMDLDLDLDVTDLKTFLACQKGLHLKGMKVEEWAHHPLWFSQRELACRPEKW